MKLKSILAAAALLISIGAHAAWESDQKNGSVYSVQMPDETGAMSNVSVSLGGSFMIGTYPAGWVNDPTAVEIGRGYSDLIVNGQAVKFIVTKDSDGVIFLTARTYRGREYIKNELWSKSSLLFINSSGDRWTLSAKGFQKAWATMVQGRGI